MKFVDDDDDDYEQQQEQQHTADTAAATAAAATTTTTTLWAKTAPVYFCNNFVETFYSELLLVYLYIAVNLERRDIKITSLS